MMPNLSDTEQAKRVSIQNFTGAKSIQLTSDISLQDFGFDVGDFVFLFQYPMRFLTWANQSLAKHVWSRSCNTTQLAQTKASRVLAH